SSDAHARPCYLAISLPGSNVLQNISREKRWYYRSQMPPQMMDTAPQADRLDLVRAVVRAIADGSRGSSNIAAACGIAPRYARYCVHAGRLLTLLEGNGDAAQVTSLGLALLETPAGSEDERQFFIRAMLETDPFQSFARLLLESEPSIAE